MDGGIDSQPDRFTTARCSLVYDFLDHHFTDLYFDATHFLPNDQSTASHFSLCLFPLQLDADCERGAENSLGCTNKIERVNYLFYPNRYYQDNDRKGNGDKASGVPHKK